MKVCIVIANYYPQISRDLLLGATKVLKKNGVKKFKIILAPGVFEVPVLIASSIKKYDAFIALGCVIKGKTPHFDFISKSSIDAIMKLSINYKKPIGNGKITFLKKKNAFETSNPKKKNKGGEAAKAILSIIKNVT